VLVPPDTSPTFAHMASVVTDSSGADLTFTGLAAKIRYWNDITPRTSAVEVTGLGGVTAYRLVKTWESTVSWVCLAAQGSDGVWEDDVDVNRYLCTGVTPSTGDTTPPDPPTGLTITPL